VRLLHRAAKTNARFDDPNLVSHAGLVSAVRLAENIGLEKLVTEHMQVAPGSGRTRG
jgi:hypothetical protein